MKYYVDITLLPDADITLYFLWSKVYKQIHLAFVEQQDAYGRIPIGASFPQYCFDEKSKSIGYKLRLCSPKKEALEALNLGTWLSLLSDYTHITSIRQVPDVIDRHACFKRIQVKNSNERLARRKAKRHGTSLKEALKYYARRKEQYSAAPYIRMQSLSSMKQYRIIIAMIDSDHEQIGDGFSTYGLSATSTVPLF